MTRILASLLVGASLLTACSGEAEMVSTSDSVAQTLNVSIDEGYVIPPLRGRDVGGGFFVAQNDGPATAILSASSPFADSVEVHTHLMEDGVMKMRQVERVDLPAGERVDFEPGGYHLMMFGFRRAEGQDAVPVTLTLDGGQTLELMLPIQER